MNRHAVRALSRAVKYYVGGFARTVRREHLLLLSSGIAFNGLLCLLPLLLLLTWLLGLVLASPKFPAQRIDDILNAIFPVQPYAFQLKSALLGVVQDIVRYRSTFGVSGIAVLIWTAASLFGSVRSVLHRIYKIVPTKLVILTILENIGLVLLLGLLFLTANAFTWVLLLADSLVRDIPGLDLLHLPAVSGFIRTVVSYLAAFIMFFVVNRFIPDGRIAGSTAAVAALTSTTLWWAAGKAFGWYLTTFHSYSKVYGTYAFALVFLVWIYYSSIVFVAGVVVAQLYRERPAIPANRPRARAA